MSIRNFVAVVSEKDITIRFHWCRLRLYYTFGGGLIFKATRYILWQT